MNTLGALTCNEIEPLLPAAAAGALDPDDERRVQDHLLDCAACLPKLADYQDVVAQLAYAVPQVEPPPELRARLLARVGATPQGTAPAVTRVPAAAPPWRRRFAALFGAYRQAAPLALAFSLILLIAGALWISNLNGQVDAQRHMIAMLQDPTAHMVALEPMTQTQAIGQMLMTPEHARVALVVAHLMPRPGRVYQLWVLTDDGHVMPCGEVTVDDHGAALEMVTLPIPAGRSRAVMITDEVPGPGTAPSGTTWLEAQYH